MICVNTLKVSPSSLKLKEGDWYYDATVEICPTNATCSDVRWTSSNTNVATVNETTGYIHAVGKGTATIRAIAQDGSGKTDSIAVTVIEDVKITSIEMCEDEIFIRTGNTQTLCANIEPINATTPALIWSSSNPAVATVDYNVVRGVSAGTAVITACATDGSGKCACCTVTVYESTISILEKNLIYGFMAVGDSRVFHAAIIPHSEAGNENDFVWISDNPGVISIDANTGFAQVLGTGDLSVNVATISVTSPSHPTLSDSMMVFVDRYDVTSFSITPEKTALKIGDKTKMNVSISAISSSGNYEDSLTPRIIWSSSDDDIAEINESGEVTCKANGTVTITGRIGFSGDTSTYSLLIANREKVKVVLDSTNNNYFNVIFGEGANTLTWKSIGCDLSQPSSSNEIAFARYYYNAEQNYSEKQLAFIFSFDPYGVTYYLKTYGGHHATSGTDLLFFKDRVYKEIFGERPRLFLIFPNGTIQYYDNRYAENANFRNSVYSYAEMIFGSHLVVNAMTIFDFLDNIIIELVSTNTTLYDKVRQANDASSQNTATAIALATSVEKNSLDKALSLLDRMLARSVEKALIKALGWPAKLLKLAYIIGTSTVEFFDRPTAEDINLCPKINAQNFEAYFEVDTIEVPIENIR